MLRLHSALAFEPGAGGMRCVMAVHRRTAATLVALHA